MTTRWGADGVAWGAPLIAVIIGIAVWGIAALWMRRRLSRTVARVRDHAGGYVAEPQGDRNPESRFVVRVTDSEIVSERPDGGVERVTWADLQMVEVVTTDQGPFAPDVFWVLHGSDGGCAVPQGATGEAELLGRLQALPGFDNRALIEAMSSTADQRFRCWQRGGSSVR